MTAVATPSMIVAHVTVRSVERLSPSFVRVELAAPELADFGVKGPLLDQRVKLVFPGASGRVVLGSDESWITLPPEERGHMRTYTVRAVRGSGVDTRVVVDLVLHLAPGSDGPASRWAAGAKVGDRLGFVGPRLGVPFGGIEFTPPPAARLLLAGDETAVPAVSSILEALPPDAAGTAYLEVPSRDDVQDLVAPPGMRVVWLPRSGAPHGDRLCRAVLTLFGLDGSCSDPVEVDADLWETPTYSSSGEVVPTGAEDAEPVDGLYAWVAGESGAVTRLRRHLVREAGLHRRQVAFMGYWRLGVAMKS